MKKIVIIDSGMGNLRSVQKGFEQAGCAAAISRNPATIKNAAGLVFPGVGAFDAALKNLKKLKLFKLIKQQIKSGKPFLGICLGLQLLFENSEEGRLPGLRILKGKVKKFHGRGLKIPQIGWNRVKLKIKNSKVKIFKGVPDNSYFYFVHSYYAEPKDKNIIAAQTEYGKNYPSALAAGQVFAVQFHPEKSSKLGLRILRNFGKLCLKSSRP